MIRDLVHWLVLLLVVCAAGGFVYYNYENNRPCVHAVTYSIGAIDPRFGITSAQLKKDLDAAAQIWDKAVGKTLFTYSPTGAVKVSLIYDEREASARLGAEITKEQESTDAVRASIDAEHASIEAAQTALNQKINDINASGGATPPERAEITAEQQALESRITALNGDVAAFNADVRAMNAQVAEFNKTAGHLFQEGEYVRDSSGERISIFEFTSSLQLERVLAHELGHAVGLNHNADPRSIMYAENESGNLVPTATDLKDLKALCGLN